MKKVILVALCGLLSAQADAQTTKKLVKTTEATAARAVVAASEKDQKTAEWPQLTAFHKIMAQTYHPAEKGDFEPIRKRSGELMEAAKALISTPFPEAYRSSDMKVLVAKLEDGTIYIWKLTEEKAGNDELMKALTETHEVFHKIAGLCKADEHHDH